MGNHSHTDRSCENTDINFTVCDFSHEIGDNSLLFLETHHILSEPAVLKLVVMEEDFLPIGNNIRSPENQRMRCTLYSDSF